MNTPTSRHSPPASSRYSGMTSQGNPTDVFWLHPDPHHARTRGLGTCRQGMYTRAALSGEAMPCLPQCCWCPVAHHRRPAPPERVHPIKGQHRSHPTPASLAPLVPPLPVSPAPATSVHPTPPPLNPPSLVPPGARPSTVKSLGGGALVGSPTLIDDGTTRVRCGGVTGHAADRQMIRVVEVRLLPPIKHLLSSATEIGEARYT
jgi:hypothetical protein